MPHQGDSEAPLDFNFVETVTLLNDHHVPYWACHGTLLGLIRDGSLIPWDHDIDIAIWAGELSKESLIAMMVSNGYQLKSDGADYDFVAFTKAPGREVDFNFYRMSRDSKLAYSEWFISRSKITTVLDVLSRPKQYHGKWGGIVRRLSLLSPLARHAVRLMKKLGVFYKSAGYTTPRELLDEFKVMHVGSLEVRVPLRHDEVLKFVYGEKWRTPKRQYDWTTESPSTRISASRFG